MAFAELLLVFAIALTTSVGAVLFVRARQVGPSLSETGADPVLLLFDQGVLHHATHQALTSFAFIPGAHVWTDLREALLPRFPTFPEFTGFGSTGFMSIPAGDPTDTSIVELNWRDSLCWVEITRPSATPKANPEQDLRRFALTRCAATMADPAWMMLPDGEVAWQNTAFTRQADWAGRQEMEKLLQAGMERAPTRVVLDLSDGGKEHFDVIQHKKAEGTLCHARKMTDLVRAEDAQRGLLAALSDTFSHLPIGLAIFATEQQLNIFNPALVDMSGLSPSFLATRPTVLSFFDALRENRRMPEPKNYKAWRSQIAEMVATASKGTYRENWTLEDGRTFALQGRPHSDGATAFLLEDLSSEVSLTRNFRAEITQYEGVIDAIDDGLVVFSNSGVLMFCNAAYRKMWGHNPETAFADITVHDAMTLWQKQTVNPVDWQAVSRSITSLPSTAQSSFSLHMRNGQILSCQMARAGPEATLLRFARAPVDERAFPNLLA